MAVNNRERFRKIREEKEMALMKHRVDITPYSFQGLKRERVEACERNFRMRTLHSRI